MPLTKITSGEFQDSSVSFSGIVTAGSFVSGNVGIATTRATQPFQIGAGSTIVIVDGMGELGIGTTNPTSKLQVVGDARVSGVVTAFDFYNDAEYPSVRPTLDLAFAQTKILDSRIIFTRASTATYTNSSKIIQSAAINEARFDHDPATGESLGLLVEEARTNSLLGSNSFNNTSYWVPNVFDSSTITVIPNSFISPDGTLSAYKLVMSTTSSPTGQKVLSVQTVFAAGTWTFSCYIKQAELRYTALGFYDGSNYRGATIDLSNGNISNIVGGATASSVQMSNGWYRFSVTATTTGNSSSTYSGIWANSSNFTIGGSNNIVDGVSGIYVWGAQVESGSFPTSYIPTPATFTSRASTATFYTSTGTVGIATTNQARSNAFFPDSNGVMRSAGLLLEAAGTNLTRYSEQADQHFNQFGSLSLNSTTAPDGTITADKLITPSGSGSYGLLNYGGTWTAGTPHTFSIYAKKGEWNRIGIRIYDGVSYWIRATVNLTTGQTVSTESGTLSVQAFPNGWYRISLTGTPSATYSTYNNYIAVEPHNATTVQNSETGTGTEGIYIWGAQLEASPYPTSYIPTVASTVTRAADVSSSATVTRSADVATINTDLNLDAATIRSNFYLPSYSSITNSTLNYKPILCFDNTANQRFELGIEGANPSIISIASSLTMQDAVVPKQNLISVSSGAGVSGFTTTGGYIAQLSLADANGGTDAFLFIDNATDASYHHVGTAITTGGFSTNFVHVVSVYAKKYNTDYVFLQATDTGNRSANAVFDLSNPGPATQVVMGVFGTNYSTGMIDCGNDWYRLYIVFIIGSAAPVSQVRFGPAAVGVGNTIWGQGLTYTSAGYGVYFANPQIERSTVIGKYIPTTSGAVTSTYYNSVSVNKSSTIMYSYNNLNNNTGVTFDGRTPANASRRFLLRNTTFRLGSDILGNRLNGCIKGISYYPEALSNNVLQTITL